MSDRQLLLERYARERRPADLEALVEHYLPLAMSLARRYRAAPAIQADVRQAAAEGLVKALQRYDPARGVAFPTYAIPTILGEVRRFLRDNTWPAHVPRATQERARRAGQVREELTARLGRAPSGDELAVALGCSTEDALEALWAHASRTTSSYSGLGATGDGQEPAGVVVGAEDPGFERAERRVLLEEAIAQLPPSQQALVRLRFGAGLTQREMADRLGCSRSHVGRVLDASLDRLRQLVA